LPEFVGEFAVGCCIFLETSTMKKRVVPIIVQSERAECGLACLAMMAEYLGVPSSIESLREESDVGMTGMTVLDMISLGGELGLSCTPFSVPMDVLIKADEPCVLHWNSSHFVVLVKIGKGGAVIHDPGFGRQTLSLDELSENYSGIAIDVARGAQVQQPERARKRAPRLTLRDLASMVLGLKGAVTRILATALCLELFVLISPLFTQAVIDRAVPANDVRLLWAACACYGFLLIAQGLVGVLRSWLVASTSARVQVSWSTAIFARLMALPQAYFDRRTVGDISSRMSSIGSIQQTLSARLIEAVLDGILAVFTTAVLVLYSPSLALVTVGVVAVYGAVRYFYFSRMRDASMRAVQSGAKLQTVELESIRGSQTIRMYNLTGMQSARFAARSVATAGASLDVQRLNIAFGSVNFYLFSAHRVTMVAIGAYLTMQGEFSIGMLVAFLAYSDQFTAKCGSLIDYLFEVRMLGVHMDRLADIVHAKREQHVLGKGDGQPVQRLALKNVTFSYGKRSAPVLNDVSLEVALGESVAIVGASGAGKSTLLKIILGLLDPMAGSVEINGMDLRTYGKARFRDRVSAVMQDDQLFAGTIGENIALFDSNATPSRIRAAARMAQIADDIEARPMAYQSSVGDMGSFLSGGQKQRVLLARALYRHPSILVLDEATSHLDGENELLVNAAIRSLGSARIIVAHRLETIRSADRILELAEGRLVERSIDEYLDQSSDLHVSDEV